MEGKVCINIDRSSQFIFDDIDKIILEGLRDGKSSSDIGKEVFRSSRAVEFRIIKMCRMADVKKSISLVIFAIRNKVIDL